MVSSGLRDLAITIGFGFSPLSSIPPNPINNRDSQTLCRLSRKQIRKVAKANVPHKNKFACVVRQVSRLSFVFSDNAESSVEKTA